MSRPEKGFYYHYKHDPAGAFNNYAYEVLGVSKRTETDEHDVVYRPLYENTYLAGLDFSSRPLTMFMGDVKGKPRFMKITDPEAIAELAKIRDQMYP